MSLFRKSSTYRSPLQKRVAKIPSQDLAAWVTTSLFEIGRNVERWSRTQDRPYILQAQEDVEALAAVLDEIARRS